MRLKITILATLLLGATAVAAPYEFGSRDVYYPLVFYALPAGLAALGLRADMALKVTAALLDALAVPLVWAVVLRHGAGQLRQQLVEVLGLRGQISRAASRGRETVVSQLQTA